MSVLVTGAAGFIGYHISLKLIRNGFNVVGVDSVTDYYSTSLKRDRISQLELQASESNGSFRFFETDICNQESLNTIFSTQSVDRVINLAAQAGVRYSLENPHAYISCNVQGFLNILECCRHFSVKNLLYASSSSVYGGNAMLPFSEHHSVDHPVSLYAATKKANELMAHSYSHLFNIPATGLRFFTVYGPWGRPDMALFLFTKAILENKPIKVFNNGLMTRDFTYVDDIVESLFLLLNKPALPNPSFNSSDPDNASSWAPHRVFNIGNSQPVSLLQYIEELESAIGIKAEKVLCPMQPGDVEATAANTTLLEEWIDYKPSTSVKDGIASFVSWYRNYYRV